MQPPAHSSRRDVQPVRHFVVTHVQVVAHDYRCALFRGKLAPANPWGGNSLEWWTASPPPPENFETTPTVDDPYEFKQWKYDPSLDGYSRT